MIRTGHGKDTGTTLSFFAWLLPAQAFNMSFVLGLGLCAVKFTAFVTVVLAALILARLDCNCKLYML